MEQLTLEQAAFVIPEIPEHFIDGEPEAYIDGHRNGFKAGAEWQKEQYKEVIEELNSEHAFLLNLYQTSTIENHAPEWLLQDIRGRMTKLLEIIDKATK